MADSIPVGQCWRSLIDILVPSFFRTEICHVGECVEFYYESSIYGRSFDHKFSLLAIIMGREGGRHGNTSYRHAIRAITKPRSVRFFSTSRIKAPIMRDRFFFEKHATMFDYIDAVIRADVTVMSYVDNVRVIAVIRGGRIPRCFFPVDSQRGHT